MTNTDPNPTMMICRSETPDGKFTEGLSSGVELATGRTGRTVEILEPRAVPLGGPRAMTVQRTLPQRARSLIGAFCFLDFYGPDDVSVTGGMYVPRHPHTGLATVSWLFEGRIDHIDSAGNWATVRPGEVNLMNAGTGITHSEITTSDTTVLHGVQLWYAFPEHARFTKPSLDAYRPDEISAADGSWRAKVFMGSLLGQTSEIKTHIPLTAAEFRLAPGAVLDVEVPVGHEHGLLAVDGPLTLDGVAIAPAEVGYVGTGATSLRIANGSAHEVIAIFIGGEPLNEEIVMWWNFVGRSHEEIATWRAAYQQEMGFETPDHRNPIDTRAGLGAEPLGIPVSGELMDSLIGSHYEDGRVFPQFGNFPPDEPAPLPAPPLPNTRIKARRNPLPQARQTIDPINPTNPTTDPTHKETETIMTSTPDRSQASIDNPVVVQEPTRYAIYVDAESTQPAGLTAYKDHKTADGQLHRIFPHTEVDDAYSGKGLASKLVRAALDDTVAAGAKIVAFCPYVKGWIDRHEDYQQYTVRPHQDHLDTLQGR